MKIETIDVYSLKQLSYLSPIKCDDFSEAAAVCLDHWEHEQEIIIKVEGDLEAQFKLVWQKVTQQVRDSRNDLTYATEDGAYCLAMILIETLTNFQVIRQSKKGTGIDFWLAKKKNKLTFQREARLEVSGLLKGTKAEIEYRLNKKIEQAEKSNHTKLPLFVVIVEFKTPVIKIAKR